MPKPRSKKTTKAKPTRKPKRASPKATQERKKVEIDLLIRSEHPSFQAPTAPTKIRALEPEISKRLTQTYGTGYDRRGFSAERQKTFPLDPLSILVTVVIYVGLKVADKVIEKMTEDVYDDVKKNLTTASVSKAGKHRVSKAKRP